MKQKIDSFGVYDLLTISAPLTVDGFSQHGREVSLNNGAHVLIVSRDQSLLQTRTLILGAFFQVESAGRAVEAEAILAKRAFDLAVLCYSLTEDDCRKLMAQIGKQNPRPMVLALRAPGAPGFVVGASAHLVLDYGPYALLKKAAEMLGVDLKEKPKKRADVRPPAIDRSTPSTPLTD